MEIEALIGTGHRDQAARSLDELRDLAADAPGLAVTVGWLTGWLAESHGDTKKARECYETAVAAPTHPDENTLHRAFLHHAYGRLLLTVRDRRAARRSLRTARDLFAALGAQPFLERCDQDLRVSGLHAPKGAPDKLLALTDREREVVNLILQDFTNAEIAGELYISIKAVEYHLRNAYAKFHVSTRRQLRKVLNAKT